MWSYNPSPPSPISNIYKPASGEPHIIGMAITPYKPPKASGSFPAPTISLVVIAINRTKQPSNAPNPTA